MNKPLILLALLIGFLVGDYVGRRFQRRADLKERPAIADVNLCVASEDGQLVESISIPKDTMVTAATTAGTQVMTCSIIDPNKKK
jgi:hypothetical protein